MHKRILDTEGKLVLKSFRAPKLLPPTDHTRCARGEAGFTLVEVAMVTVLLALLSGVIYSTLSGIVRTKEKLESERAITRTGQYVIQRLTRELQNHANVYLLNVGVDDMSLFGRNGQLGGSDSDIIAFVSNNAGQTLSEGGRNVGAVQLSYRLVESQGQDGRPRRQLIREERPAGISDPNILRERTIAFPISDLVTQLNFRFRRGTEGPWLDEWRNRPDKVPDAVEITIRVEDWVGTGETFRTAVRLPR